MARGPRDEKRPVDVIGNAVKGHEDRGRRGNRRTRNRRRQERSRRMGEPRRERVQLKFLSNADAK
jgi:hypothetical protein